jgi:hypothetical protein
VITGSSDEQSWDDQVDLCPDALYIQISNQEPEDLFQILKGKVANA